MVKSAATAISPGTASGFNWTMDSIGADIFTGGGYSWQKQGPLVLEGAGIGVDSGTAFAALVGFAAFRSGTNPAVRIKIKFKGLHSGKTYHQSDEIGPVSGQTPTFQADPTAIDAGDVVTCALEQTAGPTGSVLDGGFATQWAPQRWHYVNAVRAWSQRQAGDRELIDVELQQPDYPSMWLFCCVEVPIGMVTKRAGVIVPHGPRYYLNCDPTIFVGTTTDAIHWSYNLPLCSCPEGQEQKAALGRLGVAPEIIWHSRLHLLPHCPQPDGFYESVGTAWLVFNSPPWYLAQFEESHTAIGGLAPFGVAICDVFAFFGTLSLSATLTITDCGDPSHPDAVFQVAIIANLGNPRERVLAISGSIASHTGTTLSTDGAVPVFPGEPIYFVGRALSPDLVEGSMAGGCVARLYISP